MIVNLLLALGIGIGVALLFSKVIAPLLAKMQKDNPTESGKEKPATASETPVQATTPPAAPSKAATPSKPSEFYVEVSNKYTAFGGLYAEGKMKYGDLRVGESVYVYDKNGRIKYENAKVSAINNGSGIRVNSIKMGDGEYAAIMLDGVRNVGDIEYGDIISKQKLKLETPAQEEPPVEEKVLPEAKTYNHADRKTHITMATNDIASMCASGSLAKQREWIRNVGQDLYDVHGFSAMQEVFINVKMRYPSAQSQLSSIWDGVGGWAD